MSPHAYGLLHVAWLAGIAGVSIVLSLVCGRNLVPQPYVRAALICLLVGGELTRLSTATIRFPGTLLLNLCNIVTWVAVLACLNMAPLAVEFVYLVGFSGAAMSLLTPDFGSGWPAQFFLNHGAIILTASALAFGRMTSLRAGLRLFCPLCRADRPVRLEIQSQLCVSSPEAGMGNFARSLRSVAILYWCRRHRGARAVLADVVPAPAPPRPRRAVPNQPSHPRSPFTILRTDRPRGVGESYVLFFRTEALRFTCFLSDPRTSERDGPDSSAVIQAWRSVIFNYREGGIGQIGRKLLWRFTHWLRSDSAWLVYRMDGDPRAAAALTLTCSHLGFEELRDLGYYKAVSFPEGIQSRLASGAVCNGFFVNRELANVAWTSEGFLEIETGVVVREGNCVGIFDCFTMPAHRGKGIYTDTLIRLTSEIHGRGATAFIAVDPENIRSIRGIEKAGFQPLYRLERVCRFGRTVLRKKVGHTQD